jgi:phosphoribosyl-AMP cyclohydrolase / phosphoribosyl-ATP pyrophosphohydrolase
MNKREVKSQSSLAFLERLEEVIQDRITNPPADSYVAGLVRGGNRRRAQKVGEEAVELVIAAASGDKKEQIEEAADLLFHLLVLLNCNGIRIADVADVLQHRHRQRPAG